MDSLLDCDVQPQREFASRFELYSCLVYLSLEVMHSPTDIFQLGVVVRRKRLVTVLLQIFYLRFYLSFVQPNDFVMSVHFDMLGFADGFEEMIFVHLCEALNGVVGYRSGDFAQLRESLRFELLVSVCHWLVLRFNWQQTQG